MPWATSAKTNARGALDGEAGSHGAPAKLRMYYILTPLLVFSMLLVTLANNLGVMWAAIELTTLASVFLVTFYGNVTSLEAAWKYAMIGGVGLSMALFGTVLTYYAGHKLPGSEGLAGLNWSNLVSQAAQLDKTSMRMAFILVLLGYGTKAGLAPMHTWKPDAYSEAPGALGRHPVGRHVELRGLRPGALLRADQPLPGNRVSRQPPAHPRTFFHGDRRAVRSGPEELPAHAGLFHHRSGRHDDHRPRHRRQARRVCADAAHDVSHGGEVAALPFRPAISINASRPTFSRRSGAAFCACFR